MIADVAPFQPWGLSHILMLSGSFILPAALAFCARWIARDRFDLLVRRVLAAVIGLSWLGWYAIGAARGWLDWGNLLPLNLCDWAAAATIWALLQRRQGAFELAYYWALGGTLQALISPDIPFDFPEIRMLQFAGFHCGILTGMLYLCFSGAMRPHACALKGVLAATALYGLCAGAADLLLGVNYGFLRAKPEIVSALSIMPDWPGYLPLMVLSAVLAVFLCYAPYVLLDRLRQRPA